MSVKFSTVRYLSNAVVNVPRNCWELWKQLISSNFQNGIFEVITITVTKIVLIQGFLLLLLLKKNEMVTYGIPWHIHTFQKSALLKTRESHFSVLWVMLSVISLGCNVFKMSRLFRARNSLTFSQLESVDSL